MKSFTSNLEGCCLSSSTDSNSKKNQSPEVFCKKSVLENFTNFKGKYLCCSLFLRPPTLLKDSNTVVFL